MKSVLAFGDSNTWGLIPGSRNNDVESWTCPRGSDCQDIPYSDMIEKITNSAI